VKHAWTILEVTLLVVGLWLSAEHITLPGSWGELWWGIQLVGTIIGVITAGFFIVLGWFCLQAILQPRD
jgi:hypothetical protein